MRPSRIIAALSFIVQADFVDSESSIVRSMNQHVLLQVKTTITLEDDASNALLSNEKVEQFESIPLEWILQVDELLFDSASSGSSEQSTRLDERILHVQWSSTKQEGGWTGAADYSLLLPLETSTRRSNRALLLAIWEMNVETEHRRFLTQQLVHVPKTTPLAGIASNGDYSWKPNTVIELNIKSRHNRHVGTYPKKSEYTTTSYGFWIFIAVSLAGLLQLWKGSRPNREEVRRSVDENAVLHTNNEVMRAANNIVGSDERASVNDSDWDERSLSPAFVLLRDNGRCSDSSDDDDESEEQDLILERPPIMQRQLMKSFIDEGGPFVEALEKATEAFILERQCRTTKALISIENEDATSCSNDGKVSVLSGSAKSPKRHNIGPSCSSAPRAVGPSLLNHELHALRKLGDDCESFGMGAFPKVQTKVVTAEGDVNSGKQECVRSSLTNDTNWLPIDHSTEEVTCNEQIVDDTTFPDTETKINEELVAETNAEELNTSAMFQSCADRHFLSNNQSKKRMLEMTLSEENEQSGLAGNTGSPIESSTPHNSSSEDVPDIMYKRQKGPLTEEESGTSQSRTTATGEEDLQKDMNDDRGNFGQSSSFSPSRSTEGKEIETTRNDPQDRAADIPIADVVIDHDDVTTSCVPAAVEQCAYSRLVDGESSITEIEETLVLGCPKKGAIFEPTIFHSPIPDNAESVLIDKVAGNTRAVSEELAFSLPVSAPPDSPYTSTLPPDSSSSCSDVSVDTPGKGHLEYTKTIFEKSAELRTIVGDDILADFVPSAALQTAAMAMKDFSFEFEGKGSRAKPLTLKELIVSDSISKRPARSKPSSVSTRTSESKNGATLQHHSEHVSNIMSPDSTIQKRGSLGGTTPALTSIISPPLTAKPVKRAGKKMKPPPPLLPTDGLVTISSRKRRISFTKTTVEPSVKMKKLKSHHPVDPFDFKDDEEKVDSFDGKDDTQKPRRRARALSFR